MGFANLTFSQRIDKYWQPLLDKIPSNGAVKLAIALLKLMEQKKSNLCVSLDVTRCEDILRIADIVGPYVVLVKLHIDIVEDFPQWDSQNHNSFIDKLNALAQKHQFYIFEDRKFADIGNTVKMQYGYGIYRISSWAHIINVHGVPGDGIVDGLKSALQPSTSDCDKNLRGCLMISQMSSKGSLANGVYSEKCVEMACKRSDFIIGFIAGARPQQIDEQFVDMIVMTPGVQIQASNDKLGQQYNTPENVINELKSDLIIVGRGIIGRIQDMTSEDEKMAEYEKIKERAAQYNTIAWQCYQNRVGVSNTMK
ncbi:hypothetical protein MIR68_004517 [Amoeboaphelidium protococcarum]|nr:hypothetical protein MIR68_004517 [Amoeboaphelidium protococcarum]